MSNGFQSRPKGEPASAGGAFVASVQPVVGPEVQRLVQCHNPGSSNSRQRREKRQKAHPVAETTEMGESGYRMILATLGLTENWTLHENERNRSPNR